MTEEKPTLEQIMQDNIAKNDEIKQLKIDLEFAKSADGKIQELTSALKKAQDLNYEYYMRNGTENPSDGQTKEVDEVDIMTMPVSERTKFLKNLALEGINKDVKK